MLPNVLGIACTDNHGRIYFESDGKKKLIARAPETPEWVSDFDFMIFKRFLDTHWGPDDRCLVVIGKNTYEEAKKLIHSHMKNQKSALLVSTKNELSVIHSASIILSDAFGTPVKQEPIEPISINSLQNLRVIAYKTAIKMHADKVIVLGGNSVYRAFSGCYDLFMNCVIHSRLGIPLGLEKRLDIQSLLIPQKPMADSQSQGSGWMHGNYKTYKRSSVFVDFDYTVEEIKVV